MKILEIQKKSKPDLQKLLHQSRDKLRQLHFDLSSGRVKNVREIRNLKKDIARILTILKRQSISEGGRGGSLGVAPSGSTQSAKVVK